MDLLSPVSYSPSHERHMHADNMASKKLLIFLIWIEGLGCHCQRLSAEVTPNLKHRSNIPKQTLEEILNSQKASYNSYHDNFNLINYPKTPNRIT